MSKILKNKVFALLVGFVLVLMLSYALAISKTMHMRKEFHALEREQQQYNNLSQQLLLLHKKEVYLDSTLQSLNLDNTSIENNLLRVVNQEAERNHLKVINFDPPHVHEMAGTQSKTFNFVLRGTFIDILKAVHSIEMQSSFGEVVHLNLVKQKNYRTGQDFLEATVFVQKLE
ncbi:hypothetical protein [Flagellimonas taeanensis]|uniref:hypothetical protein n=1 Tax=Flagellimonas taeanensis TaxID=1005926 RepID=UPI0011605E7D|nr:hypothetical protein [Allomuricauda taeanensis]